MLARDAKIYKDTFTLAETIFRYTGKFDRRFRNSVAQKMEQKVLDLSDIIVRANLVGFMTKEIVELIGEPCF